MIADRLNLIRSKIKAACQRCGRSPSEVRLVAVSKNQPIEKVREAAAIQSSIDLCFGENYVNEALEKRTAEPKLHWHFIGALQSNKVKQLVGQFELIHSIDRESVLRELSKRSRSEGWVQDILLEVNVAGEASKAGMAPSELAPILKLAQSLPGIRVRGLMAMPPLSDAESSRPYFRELREILRPNRTSTFCELSMGTSQDFEVAIEEGATLIRVGTDIFGPRERKEKS